MIPTLTWFTPQPQIRRRLLTLEVTCLHCRSWENSKFPKDYILSKSPPTSWIFLENTANKVTWTGLKASKAIHFSNQLRPMTFLYIGGTPWPLRGIWECSKAPRSSTSLVNYPREKYVRLDPDHGVFNSFSSSRQRLYYALEWLGSFLLLTTKIKPSNGRHSQYSPI